MSIRVMSFNIRGADHPQDGVNQWHLRSALNVQTIRKHNPDLIGFQELQNGNLETYRAQLTDYHYILGCEASGGSEHPSIFWKPSTLELVDTGGFWISETPEVYSGSWNTDCERAATWVRLREKSSGVEFIHMNTHLDHRSDWARTEGCRLLVRRITALRLNRNFPTILTGDFNCDAYQPPQAAGGKDLADKNYRFLLDSGFVDTYLAAGNADSFHSNTFHGFLGDQFAPDPDRGFVGRIDWLLALDGTQHIEVQSAEIIRDNAAPVYPSDHYPILAELIFA